MEAARELKPRRALPRTRRVQKKRRRQKRFSTMKKKCNELLEDMEGEEDSWANAGMDDDEETLPQEQHAGKEAGGEKQFRARPRRTTSASRCWAPKENPAQRMRWGLSPASSEPRPTQLQVADEMLTFLGEAAFENEQIVSSNGHCTEPVGAESVQGGLGQATGQGLLILRQLCRALPHALVQTSMEVEQRMQFCHWSPVRTDWKRRPFAMTRRNWDSEQKRKQTPNKEEHRKREVPEAMELVSRRVSWAKRMAE